ncbi:MAG: hypothetical protein AAF639_34805, partial [Chloroflexota bacterium]
FIKHAEDLNIVPTHVQEPELQVAYDIANRFQWNRDDLDQYEYRGIKIQDERGARSLARKEGHAEGHAEGIAMARAEAEVTMRNTARNLLSMGLSIEQIIEATGLSTEQIEELS